MEYRWYIGRYLDTGTNLIRLIAADWTEQDGTATYIFGVDTVTHSNVAPNTVNCIESNNNIFTVGEYFQISVEYVPGIAPGISAFKPYVGNYTLKAWEGWRDTETITFDAYCRAGTKMRITGREGFTLNDLTVYQYYWLPVLEEPDCPVVKDGLKLGLKRSERFLTTFVSYIEEVVFHGAAYDRLVGLVQDGFKEIPVKVEARATKFDAWEEVFLGTIYESDIKFTPKTQTAIVDVEDNGAGNALLKNIDKAFPITTSDARRYQASYAANYYVPIDIGIDCHKPDDGTYLHPYGALETFQVKTFLEDLLWEASGLVVGLSSTYLTDRSKWYPGGAATENVGLTTRKLTQHPFYTVVDHVSIKTSVKEIMEEYWKCWNIYAYVDNSDQRQLIVEDKATLVTNSGITLADVNDIQIVGRKSVGGVDIGFLYRSTKDDTGVRTFRNKASNNEGIIDIVTRFYAGNTNEQNNIYGTTLDILANYHWALFVANYGATSKQNDAIYLLEYETGEEPGTYISLQGTNFIYNPSFDIVDWIARHEVDLSDEDTFTSFDDANFYVYGVDNKIEFDGTDRYNYECSFKYPLSWADFQTIMGNPFAYIIVQSEYIHPYNNTAINNRFIIEELKYNLDTKMAEFTGRLA